MSIEKLVKLVPPPKEPVELGTKKDWSRAEKTLGVKLPSDYKEFIDRYGSGEFAGFFLVFNPFSKTINLLDKFETLGASYRDSHDSDPDNFPLAMFPEVPGMIPWGHDTNGHTYFWLVKNKKTPDEWTIVWDEGDDQGFEEHKWTFSEYLLGVLKGKIDARAGNYPSDDSFRFEPLPVGSSDNRVDELYQAVDAQDESKIRELATAGVDLNAPNKDGFTALLKASQTGYAMVRLLLDLGADPKKSTLNEHSLLEGPAYGDDFGSLDALLAAGADVTMSWTKWKTNALNSACSEKMIRRLIDAGCKPTGQDYSENQTPLFWAVQNDNPEVARLLIEHGIDVNARARYPRKGITALGLAKDLKRTTILKILKAAGATE
jgi:SMI1-KNR4 cell-wall/Ankyrin repeats (3 copies)